MKEKTRKKREEEKQGRADARMRKREEARMKEQEQIQQIREFLTLPHTLDEIACHLGTNSGSAYALMNKHKEIFRVINENRTRTNKTGNKARVFSWILVGNDLYDQWSDYEI